VLGGDEQSQIPQAQKLGTQRTLLRVLEALLRLSHPFMPYITEELWQKVAPKAGISGDTIMQQPYPVCDPDRIDKHAVAEVEWIKSFILGIRKIRAEYDIAPGKPLPVLCENASAENKDRVERHTGLLQALAKTEAINVLADSDAAPESATALVGEMRILIPLAGLIDPVAENKRLDRESDRLSKEKGRLEGKLGNDSFVSKAPAAPADVVDKEKQKLADVLVALEQLKQQKDRLKNL